MDEAQTLVGKMELGLLPNEVLVAMVRLELALEQHTDYKEVRIDYKLNTSTNPVLHFLVDAE